MSRGSATRRIRTCSSTPSTRIVSPSAVHGIRLLDLLDATRLFRKVIITCRTQFFEVDAQIEQFGSVRVGPYQCPSLYLSPFNDEQVEHYLHRRFPPSFWQRVGLAKLDTQPKARAIAFLMGNLRARPLLLSYIDDIITGTPGGVSSEFSLYKIVVEQWLRREHRKARDRKDFSITEDRLLRGSIAMAFRAQEAGARDLSLDDIREISRTISEIETIDRLPLEGRSLINRNGSGGYRFAHYSFQEFLIAYALTSCPRSHVPPGGRPVRWTNLLSFFFRQAMLTASRANLDMSDVGFVGADLNGVNFSGVRLVGANFENANLSQCNLSRCDLRRVVLKGVTLEGADMAGANLADADLRNARLSGPSSYAISDYTPRLTNLQGATLFRADLSQATLAFADLRNVDLSNATLVDAKLANANLSGAKLVNCNLTRADLTGATLAGTDLQCADLTGALLAGATLDTARLEGAILKSAKLTVG